jgi:ectoine hydroxylase-related dioxygenase (phytanoyl-CoA dioxygenase family)
MMNDTAMAFETDGAELYKEALKPCMAEMETALSGLALDKAGIRIHSINALEPLLAGDGCIGAVAKRVLGPKAMPVRATLFNKTRETNWSLAWHQDRTICVKQRLEAPGFGPWTIKCGMHHVAPPFSLLSRMVTLRAHLDDVPPGNAPLLVAPGSHTFGRIPVDAVNRVVRRCGVAACLADAGDLWLYATPILHASDAAIVTAKRRVLQIDFAAETLPYGLEWLGV